MTPTRIIALDPGEKRTAYVILDESGNVVEHGIEDNAEMVASVRLWRSGFSEGVLAIEMIASYGMPVGREVFETVLWIGRYQEAWWSEPTFDEDRRDAHLVYRRDVKLYLCGSSKARDATIRTALLDRFGPGKEKAVGTKKAPGPLYGISGDEWSALAVAVTFADGRRETP